MLGCPTHVPSCTTLRPSVDRLGAVLLVLTWIKPSIPRWTLAVIAENLEMTEPTDVIMQAIRSAFDSYPREGDPDWRSPSWIMPEECRHLSKTILLALDAAGFQIVRKPSA
jgi:hypothetical protein